MSDDGAAPHPSTGANRTWIPTGDYAIDRTYVLAFVSKHLKPSTDMGPVSGRAGKFMLYQPGADKLAALFNLGHRVEILREIIEPGSDLVVYVVKVALFDLNSS